MPNDCTPLKLYKIKNFYCFRWRILIDDSTEDIDVVEQEDSTVKVSHDLQGRWIKNDRKDS